MESSLQIIFDQFFSYLVLNVSIFRCNPLTSMYVDFQFFYIEPVLEHSVLLSAAFFTAIRLPNRWNDNVRSTAYRVSVQAYSITAKLRPYTQTLALSCNYLMAKISHVSLPSDKV